MRLAVLIVCCGRAGLREQVLLRYSQFVAAGPQAPTMANPETFHAQTVVIGAGVVGLAIAQELALQGREVLVLEAGQRFGEGVSSRNSEVVHGGLYYPQHSLKAELCVQGRQALYDFCETRHLPFRKCGKWKIGRASCRERVFDRV